MRASLGRHLSSNVRYSVRWWFGTRLMAKSVSASNFASEYMSWHCKIIHVGGCHGRSRNPLERLIPRRWGAAAPTDDSGWVFDRRCPNFGVAQPSTPFGRLESLFRGLNVESWGPKSRSREESPKPGLRPTKRAHTLQKGGARFCDDGAGFTSDAGGRQPQPTVIVCRRNGVPGCSGTRCSRACSSRALFLPEKWGLRWRKGLSRNYVQTRQLISAWLPTKWSELAHVVLFFVRTGGKRSKFLLLVKIGRMSGNFARLWCLTRYRKDGKHSKKNNCPIEIPILSTK